MASNGTIAHRFANRDYNFERGLTGSSTHISGKNYYSYSTVFGQWVDEKVCVIYNGSTSITSSKHQLWSSDFPKYVVLLPYDDRWNGYYGYYHGCDLLGYSREFTYDHRVELIDYYVNEIYESLHAIVDGKSKGLEEYAEGIISEYWGYVMKLCSLYRDTTINKWLRKKRVDLDGKWEIKKRIVKELDAQNMDVKSLVDIAFGKGTWKRYYDYCGRYRKSSDKREKMESLCKRLGIGSPYVSYRGYQNRMSHEMSADDIRKLTAKERLDLHFKALAYKEYKEHEKERDAKYNRNSDNAYKWITGYAPKLESMWNHEYRETRECRNMFTGQVYDLPKEYVYGFYWAKTSVKFDYDQFRKADDKEQWIRSFYAECEEVQDNCKALEILKRVGAHTCEKQRSYDDDRFIDDDFLRENTTESEYWYAHRFIEKQEKHYADEEAQRRAAEIARLQREEEKRKEKEYQEKVKQEQIDACKARGVDGYRDLWRLHYMDIYGAESQSASEHFFYGGNVLLRFGINKDKIESSKHIRVTIPTCKAMWKLVNKWHENPSSFKQMTIKTLDGTYTISSYRNDILTAGCHDIAYAEMERMYNEIVKLENNAA